MLKRARLVTLLAVILLFITAGSQAAYGQPPHRRLDHFRGYPITEAVPATADQSVILQDQFDIAAGTREEVRVLNPAWFANPVAKRHGRQITPITNPDGHLKFYKIEPAEPDPERIIRYRNQFQRRGWGSAHLGQPIILAVPTQKIRPGDHDPPEGLDHFKCYDVLRFRPAGATVDLRDQFQAELGIEVGGMVLFCNPTRKFDPETGEAVGVTNARAHLACYRTWVTTSDEPLPAVLANNQFGDEQLSLDPADLLCVPTRKHPRFRVIDPE